MEIIKFISKFQDDYMVYREKTEWANYWWDQAFEPSSERILMIGDSSTRFYRHYVADKLKCAVDFFGTSSSITDPLFARELEMFFSTKEYHYEFIYVQLGVHGIVTEGNRSLLEDHPNYYDFYEQDYRDLVLFLKTKCSRLVLGTITPVVRWRKIHNPLISKLYMHLHSKSMEILDERFDPGIRKRNKIVIKVAQELNVPVNDLYYVMSVGEGKNFRHMDHVHYEKAAKKIFSDRLISYYEEMLK